MNDPSSKGSVSFDNTFTALGLYQILIKLSQSLARSKKCQNNISSNKCQVSNERRPLTSAASLTQRSE